MNTFLLIYVLPHGLWLVTSSIYPAPLCFLGTPPFFPASSMLGYPTSLLTFQHFIKSIKETSSQYMKILFHITVETFEGEYHVLKTKHKYFSWAARGVDSDKKRKARNPIFSLIAEPGFLFLFEWTWRQGFKQENHSSRVLFRLERIRKLSVTAREAEWKTYGFQLPVSALIP